MLGDSEDDRSRLATTETTCIATELFEHSRPVRIGISDEARHIDHSLSRDGAIAGTTGAVTSYSEPRPYKAKSPRQGPRRPTRVDKRRMNEIVKLMASIHVHVTPEPAPKSASCADGG